jgi:F420-dependent oxidoreductase-like protein
MRVGYSLGSLAGSGLTPAVHADLARTAERLGFDSLWSSEVAATDPVGFLGWLAAQTSSIRLGSAVLQISGRSAVTMAASAATLSRLSGGRFMLGIGTSGPQVVEGWHGQRYDRPLARTRDYVAVLRMALAGETVRYRGETLALPLSGSQVAALPFSPRGPVGRVHIYLAGLGPKAVALAGELGDGWLAIHSPPEYLARARSWLQAGAGAAQRQPDQVDIAAMVLTMVEDDEELARDLMRPQLALYVGGMGTQRANYYNRLAQRLGFGAAASRIQSAYLAGHHDEAMAAIPDEMVDAMTLCGPAAKVKERLGAYRTAGTGTLILGMATPGARARHEQLERIAELIH